MTPPPYGLAHGHRIAIRGGRHGQAFTPLDLSPLAWLDAAEGLTKAGGGTPSVGDAVENWADQSGNGNDASNAGVGTQPTYQEYLGSPVLDFDGSNDFLDFAGRLMTQSTGTIFAVVEVLAAANTIVFGQGVSTLSVGGAVNMPHSIGGQMKAFSPSTTTATAGSTVLTPGTVAIGGFLFGGGSDVSFRLDGAAESVTPSAGSPGESLGSSATYDMASIGRLPRSSPVYTVLRLRELQIWNTKLAAADVASLEGYLTAKHA